MSNKLAFYHDLLGDIKHRVCQAQHRAALSANAEMIAMYWDIGCMIAARQHEEGWGSGVIPRLATDLKNEMPEQKGFSARNIGRMIGFYREYPILPRPVAKLAHPSLSLADWRIYTAVSWAHNVILIEKLKDLPTRYWYARQALEQGWSRGHPHPADQKPLP